jgi:hypothetical protein
MTTSPTKLDTFTLAYIECALWSSTDNADETGGEPLDANYDLTDISPETLAQMISDCEAFQIYEARPLSICGLTPERSGHDFWLTRNRHGAGFWDEGFRGPFTQAALKRLTDASHAYGSFDLYVGDDGMIYGS